MGKKPVSPYFAYCLMLTLVAALFSTVAVLPQSYAAHDNITIDIDDEYDQDESIEIEGSIDDVENDVDEVTVTVTDPDGDEEDGDQTLDNDDSFTFDYDIGNEEGIYTVEVEYDNESTFSYFLVDEDPDDVDVSTDSFYEQGDNVEITGTVEDPQTGVDEVELTVEDPHGDAIVDEESEDVDNDEEFSHDFDLDDDAPTGRYAVKVVYDGNEAGWFIFEVEEGSGSGTSVITATVTDTTLAPGDEVEITGSIDEDDVEVGEEVILTVEDPDGDVLDLTGDSEEPNSDGEFEFTFDLDDDAETGVYDVTLEYTGYDDKALTFTVSTTSGGGSGGSGGSSGSDGGLTARLSKSSFLAGEELTVSGVVPRISGDEDGVSITVSNPSNFPIATKFPEPETSRSYSASFFLPQSLAEDEDYRVVVNYDGNEVELSFDITGKVTGGTGGPISVQTDKASYSAGSTVIITGEIADALIVEGRQVALQVFNPADAAYRFDPIVPEDDGTFSYSMPIGGPLGVSGEWEVKVTYNGQVAETTFDLTGGVAAPPTYQLKFEDQTFPIEYSSDGTINNMYLRPAEKKLVIAITDDAEGKLTITLPREVIDAVQGSTDIKYIVTTIDIQSGEETQIDITESLTNAEERTIVIDYDEGTDLIEILGTNVVPEFGALSAILLAIAVLGIVAVTTKFSNRFSAYRHW
jgi:predicted secreted protein with PEFG-CTERM motif